MDITDLTGTIWRFNSTISNLHTGPKGYDGSNYSTTVDVNFKVDSLNLNGCRLISYARKSGGTYSSKFCWYSGTSSSRVEQPLSSLYNTEVIFLENPSAYESSYRPTTVSERIYINYGLSDFISWLESNATYIGKVPPKSLIINNKNTLKINNKNINFFNGTSVMSGITKYNYTKDGSNLIIEDAPFMKNGTELTIE